MSINQGNCLQTLAPHLLYDRLQQSKTEIWSNFLNGCWSSEGPSIAKRSYGPIWKRTGYEASCYVTCMLFICIVQYLRGVQLDHLRETHFRRQQSARAVCYSWTRHSFFLKAFFHLRHAILKKPWIRRWKWRIWNRLRRTVCIFVEK
jgi:hypothetical protein